MDRDIGMDGKGKHGHFEVFTAQYGLRTINLLTFTWDLDIHVSPTTGGPAEEDDEEGRDVEREVSYLFAVKSVERWLRFADRGGHEDNKLLHKGRVLKARTEGVFWQIQPLDEREEQSSDSRHGARCR